MKLFRKICARVSVCMTGLALGILFFLLSSMLRQSINDVICYTQKEIGANVSVIREKVHAESATEKAVRDAIIINEFRQIFHTDSVLWKNGKELWNATPYEIDRSRLNRLSGNENLHSSEIYTSRPQKAEGKILIIFYQKEANLGADGYSLAAYRDVTDIYAGVWKLFIAGAVFSAVLFCLAAAFLYQGIRRILFPLEELKYASARMAEGEYDIAISAASNDEIGEVTESFNQMAKKIRQHMEALKEVSEKQQQLLGSLSHEMKTPVTAIIGNAEVLLALRLGESDREKALFYILNESRRLARLSEKMMEFSGLCANSSSSISIKKQTMKRILGQLKAVMSFQMEEKQVSINVACLPDTLEIRADEDLLFSLLWNLTDNAYKASEPGGKIEILADEQKISVQDYGKGIPAGEIAHVTEAFYRADKSRSGKTGGIGLGLALCCRIAEIHGWELQIESKEGEGTKVIILWRA